MSPLVAEMAPYHRQTIRPAIQPAAGNAGRQPARTGLDQSSRAAVKQGGGQAGRRSSRAAVKQGGRGAANASPHTPALTSGEAPGPAPPPPPGEAGVGTAGGAEAGAVGGAWRRDSMRARPASSLRSRDSRVFCLDRREGADGEGGWGVRRDEFLGEEARSSRRWRDLKEPGLKVKGGGGGGERARERGREGGSGDEG